MGVVYRAEDQRIGRQVAIKTLTEGFSGQADMLERFYREAQAGILRHSNIVIVYDLGDEEGVPFIVMEYVNGEPLDKIISSGRAAAADRQAQLSCTSSGTLAQGPTSSTATCTISTLMGGTHNVTATYVPGTDPNYSAAGPSTPFSQVVNPGTTTVTLTSVPTTSSVNQSVTFTTVVTPALLDATNPQGAVTLTDGLTGTTLCTVTLNPNATVPTCTTTLGLAGAHTITASYTSSNTDYSGTPAPTIR